MEYSSFLCGIILDTEEQSKKNLTSLENGIGPLS